jgi:hypothetical protein
LRESRAGVRDEAGTANFLMISRSRTISRTGLFKIALAVWLFCLAAPGSWLKGADATPSAGENFGQYLVDHQDDLAPFFSKHSGDFVGQGVPLVLGWLGRIMFLTLILGWILDVGLSLTYSALFAPLLSRWPRAFIYATGRLVLSVILTILLSLLVVLIAGMAHLLTAIFLVALVFLLIGFAVQVGWVIYLYRTSLPASILFYIAVIVVHGLIVSIAVTPFLGTRASAPIVQFLDSVVTPRLQDEVKATKAELATITPGRDQAASSVAELQYKISRDRTDEIGLRQQIADKKISEPYLFSQAVKVHAEGNLEAARDQLSALLGKFPTGSLTGLVEGQLNQVNSEIVAQEALRKQEAADAARAAAQAKADLLARAGKGEVTLSEMRHVLIGKTREEVKALLGVPSDTASDRWGFGQQMIVNPLTNQKYGLAVYFSDGLVQSVDYYYGTGGAQ